MCIYLKNESGLTYIGQEHIFPAALGGKIKLEKGLVSDQANSELSKLEDEMIHISTVAMCREFYGPGDRGSKTKGAGTIRLITDANTGSISMGFMCFGKTFHIPHICIKGKEYVFSSNAEDESKATQDFLKFMTELNSFEDKFVNITNADVPSDVILVGRYDRKWYVACKDADKLRSVIDAILASYKLGDKSYRAIQAKLKNQIIESHNSNRAYAKIGFNVMCKLFGKDFVLKHEFDAFRGWLINGKPFNENWMNENIIKKPDFPIDIPEHSHWCLIVCNKNKLYAFICLYDSFCRRYYIGEKPKDCDLYFPAGYICDWKNEKEYTLMEYVNKIVNSNK